jgi:8-oxo-dGTP diphosphatase
MMPTSPSINKSPALAVSVAVLHKGRVLLVRRGREPSKGLYAFPGGRVEAGEALEHAARRELLEETGLAAGALSPLTTVIIPDLHGTPLFTLTVFFGTEASGMLAPGDDAEAADWFDADEIAALPVTGNVGEIALDLIAGRPIPRHTG